jgi:hypothetical protein
MLAQRSTVPYSSRRRLLVRAVAGLVAAVVFGVVSMSGAAAPGGGGGGKSKRDTIPPTITASISQQAGTSVVVSGTASDNVGVTEVDVAIDGGGYAVAQGTTSWSYTVDTTRLAAGSHTATAKARDAAGNAATASASFSVAPVTSTPPTATILAPSANTTVAGTVTVDGTASGSNQVAKVELSVDGGAYNLAQGTTSWSGSVNTSGYTNGAHTLYARATDTAGNIGVSSEAISVTNDVAPPTVAVTTPSAGAIVSGTLSAAGTASDDVLVAKVEVSVDGGAYAAAQGTASWAYSLDTTQLANGSHTLTARATDGTGKTSTSSVAFTVSNSSSTSNGQQMVTPEGATIDIAPDVTNWTAQQIYDLLKPNAYELSRIGPTLTIKVQNQYATQTTSGASSVGNPPVYSSFSATIYLKANNSTFAISPDATLTHEYGAAWTQYHLWISHSGDWDPYLSERNLAGNPLLDSNLNWSRTELIADDYRMLFGTAAAQNELAYINPYVPDPRTVVGLKDWFISYWAVP